MALSRRLGAQVDTGNEKGRRPTDRSASPDFLTAMPEPGLAVHFATESAGAMAESRQTPVWQSIPRPLSLENGTDSPASGLARSPGIPAYARGAGNVDVPG